MVCADNIAGESDETFLSGVRPVIELGVSGVALYLPEPGRAKPVFERIARNVFPSLRATYRGHRQTSGRRLPVRRCFV